MKTAILTDSGANLSKEFILAHKNLFVVPLMIHIDDQQFRDQVEVFASEIYAKIDAHSIKTSLPLGIDLHQTIDEIKAKGYENLIVINISSGLSGTYNFFRLALQSTEGINVFHYDTLTLAGGEGFIVEYALELAQKDTPHSSYKELLDQLRFKDSIAFYTINTLKYLRHGGRIGKVEGTIGDLLHIKPVITVNEQGVYVTLSKGFGLKRSLITMKNILEEKFGQEKIDLIIHYGLDRENAVQLGEKLKNTLNIREIKILQLTPVLGVHTGPDMVAYIARRIVEEE